MASAVFGELIGELIGELSLLAMSAIILPAPSWHRIVIRKKVRSSSVKTIARGEPLVFSTFWIVGTQVLRPSVFKWTHYYTKCSYNDLILRFFYNEFSVHIIIAIIIVVSTPRIKYRRKQIIRGATCRDNNNYFFKFVYIYILSFI